MSINLVLWIIVLLASIVSLTCRIIEWRCK